MNRRAFLTRLSSGIIGLSLVDVQWVPTAIRAAIDPAAPLTDINAITAAFLRELVTPQAWESMPIRGQFVPGDYTLGLGGFDKQWMIDVDSGEDGACDLERYIRPAALNMRHHIVTSGLTRFGALPLPRQAEIEGAVATDQVSGVTVRGLRAYDVIGSGYEDEETGGWVETRPPGWMLRFDVLGSAA